MGVMLACSWVLAVAWPDGCVDRVEDGVVVFVTDQEEEVEVPGSGPEVPSEGACFRAGRPDERDTAARRTRAAALVDALAGAPASGLSR
jgi:hypothetical protein